MTIWYRASPHENIKSTFSGEGGLYVAGRWNFLGRKSVYCSESIALCTLEWLANNGLSVSGFDYYRYSIEVPTDLTIRFSQSELPNDWSATPSTDSTRDFAEKQLFASLKVLAIAIPSVIVPEEYNLVINPLHTAFPKVFHSAKFLGKHIAPTR